MVCFKYLNSPQNVPLCYADYFELKWNFCPPPINLQVNYIKNEDNIQKMP